MTLAELMHAVMQAVAVECDALGIDGSAKVVLVQAAKTPFRTAIQEDRENEKD